MATEGTWDTQPLPCPCTPHEPFPLLGPGLPMGLSASGHVTLLLWGYLALPSLHPGQGLYLQPCWCLAYEAFPSLYSAHFPECHVLPGPKGYTIHIPSTDQEKPGPLRPLEWAAFATLGLWDALMWLVTDVGKEPSRGGTGTKPLVPVYSLLSQKRSELTGKLLGLYLPEMKQKQVGLLWCLPGN